MIGEERPFRGIGIAKAARKARLRDTQSVDAGNLPERSWTGAESRRIRTMKNVFNTAARYM